MRPLLQTHPLEQLKRLCARRTQLWRAGDALEVGLLCLVQVSQEFIWRRGMPGLIRDRPKHLTVVGRKEPADCRVVAARLGKEILKDRLIQQFRYCPIAAARSIRLCLIEGPRAIFYYHEIVDGDRNKFT